MMKHVLLTIAATAAAALLISPAPALADIKSGELGRAYQKGKEDSLVGKMSMRDELNCFHLYTIWAVLTAQYHKNLGVADGELGYGFTQI